MRTFTYRVNGNKVVNMGVRKGVEIEGTGSPVSYTSLNITFCIVMTFRTELIFHILRK